MSRKIILKSENPIIHANFEYYYYYYERDIYIYELRRKKKMCTAIPGETSL